MNLKAKAYWFFMFSRLYWALDTLLTLCALSCNTASAALLTSDPDRFFETALALSISSAIVVGFKGLMAWGEASQICRGVARDLDTIANDLRKGRIDDSKVDKRIERLKRRLPVGTCVALRY